MRKLKEECA